MIVGVVMLERIYKITDRFLPTSSLNSLGSKLTSYDFKSIISLLFENISLQH